MKYEKKAIAKRAWSLADLGPTVDELEAMAILREGDIAAKAGRKDKAPGDVGHRYGRNAALITGAIGGAVGQGLGRGVRGRVLGGLAGAAGAGALGYGAGQLAGRSNAKYHNAENADARKFMSLPKGPRRKALIFEERQRMREEQRMHDADMAERPIRAAGSAIRGAIATHHILKDTEKKAHEAIGFLKEAGVPLLVTKAMNKGKQLMQGGARAKQMSSATALRTQKQTGRAARKAFGGNAKVDTRGVDSAAKAHKGLKAETSRIGKRNAIIGGAGLAIGAGAGAAMSGD